LATVGSLTGGPSGWLVPAEVIDSQAGQWPVEWTKVLWQESMNAEQHQMAADL